MHFKDRLNREMIEAAKAREKVRLSAVRLIMAAVHNREIDVRRELDETEFLQVLSSMVKQRRDSIEQFQKGNRPDLVEKEQRELQVIQSYMPAQMTEEEILAEIDRAIGEVQAGGPKDMGKVMKVLMPRLAGRVDGRLASEKVKARLSA